MTVAIAGSIVEEGDRLYSRRLNSHGTVVKVQPNNVIVRFTRNGVDREIAVTHGGYVSTEKDVYWNPPIELDLPKNSNEKYQKILSFVETLNKVI
jgi:hypothetical protein